jgi:hypothetical protein
MRGRRRVAHEVGLRRIGQLTQIDEDVVIGAAFCRTARGTSVAPRVAATIAA